MIGNIITLREYEAVSISDRWDPVRRSVPMRVVDQLEQLNARSGKELFQVGRRTIKATNYVGTVTVGDLTIDVLPKVDRVDKGQARGKLVEMLLISGQLPLAEVGIASQGETQCSLLDIFMQLYVRGLTVEWRRGRIRNYLRKNDNRTALKGKLLFSNHIRYNLLRPDRFYTQADEYVQDIPLSRLLKAGLHVCRRYAMSETIRRESWELLNEFSEVQDTMFTSEQAAAVGIDRSTERFSPLVELCRMLLVGSVPDQTGASHTYSLMFDMNYVFERYIGVLMQRVVCPPTHQANLQVSDRYLLQINGNGEFRLKPDIAISNRQGLTCLVDTKWKRLDTSKPHNNVSQGDVYQMYAYGKEYKSPRIILLYPWVEGLNPHVARYRYQKDLEENRLIDVYTIDIGKPAIGADARCVSSQLRSIFGN